ncbi:MAG: tyrosine--tRNA ligase [Candidatus Aenigmatarchaeota archaeon]
MFMERLELIKKIPTEEILTEERLKEYIENGVKLKHYIGYEISGYVHLGTGLLCMQKVADFQQAGIETNIFLADYHSFINKKLGGDLDTIRKVAGGYFKEALKLSLQSVGGDANKCNFIMGSELYEKLGLEYFDDLIKVSMNLSLSRVKRSVTIMGRREGENVDFAQLLYVPMQVADIFGLKVNLPHGGMDQRKAHVIALEVCKEFGYKPIAIHHHLLMGMHITEEQRRKILEAKRIGNRELFEEGIIEIKMSKSKPNSAIFIHDTEEEIKRKIREAYCPLREIELNPIFDLLKYIIWPYLERAEKIFEVINIKTKEKRCYNNFKDLEKDYIEGKIHPLDLKNSVANYLIEILSPARKYFLEGPGKKYLEEMKEIKITR